VLYRNLSVDFATVSQFYTGVIGFDGVRWFDSRGWTAGQGRPSPVSSKYYFINGHIHDTLFGPIYAERVENVTMDHISGDALKGGKIIRNVTINYLGGSGLSSHSDLYQLSGAHDGLLIENLTATNVNNARVFMMESFLGRDVESNATTGFVGVEDSPAFDPRFTIRNITIRNMNVQFAPGTAAHTSHMMGYFQNVLVQNSSFGGLLVRDQFSHGGADNVVLEDSGFTSYTYAGGYVLPEGVFIKNGGQVLSR
jgi:hypothetical protein